MLPFWKSNINLLRKPIKLNQTEVEKFNHKKRVENLRLFITQDDDFIGLEEIMMQTQKRFTTVIWTTK